MQEAKITINKSKPDNAKGVLNKDIIIFSMILGLPFSVFIFMGFYSMLRFPQLIPSQPEIYSILMTFFTASSYLCTIPLDKYDKTKWFRALGPIFIAFFAGMVLLALGQFLLGLILVGLLIIPAGVCSSICVSYPGYFTDISIRGKAVSITVLSVFVYVAVAMGLGFLFPDWGEKAGYLFYGIAALVLVPFTFYAKNSPRIQYISQSHVVRYRKIPNFKELRKYMAVLFLYKVCLGMLLRVFLVIPETVVTLEGMWIVVSIVAAVMAPIYGHISDKKGRKVIFNFSCATLALMFGLFAFSGQGAAGHWNVTIIVICCTLFGITYPAMLLSEYLIFQDLSGDVSRIESFARGLFVHLLGIGVGLLIGSFYGTPDVTYFLIVTNILSVGLFVTSTAKEPLPKREELLWRSAIRHLYIYYQESGVGLYECSFRPEEERADEGLITGGLTGVSGLIAEMTKSDGGLTAIQQQDANLLFHSGDFVTAALLSDKNLKVLHKKLEEIVGEFEEFFAPYLENFGGNTSVFAPTETLVRRVFIPVPKQQQDSTLIE